MEGKLTVSTKRKARVLSEPAESPAEPTRETENEKDEQMEKFYTLLDNIKAMRDAWGGGGGTSSKKTKADGRKEVEAPWRPTFRLEDFMPVEDCEPRVGERRRGDEDGGAERSDES